MKTRKKRIIVFEIRITVFTDYTLNFFTTIFEATIVSAQRFASMKYKTVTITRERKILDGKTFAEIEP